MAGIGDEFIRTRLIDRRRKLESAIARSKGAARLAELLQEVDSALERMEAGSYGLCDVCHESIEKDRIIADPLVRTCLDHLTFEERRALEQDLTLAARIQGLLLPKQNVSIGGWEIYYHYEPAGAVSGDYCDLVSTDGEEGEAFLLLGDVSGKGVAASMLMAHLHAIFRSLITIGLPVERLVERANRIFCESTMSAHFATLVCGKAGKSGELEICNAGHCPPLLLRGGAVASLEATGLPVGMFCSGEYSAKRIRLAAGDTLFLYTDGLSEARSNSDAEYGVERLSALLKNRSALGPQALVDACREDLEAFLAGAPKKDDLTIMVVRRAEQM